MPILELATRIAATSGVAILDEAGDPATVNMYYDSSNIVWPTLAEATGDLIQATFNYSMPDGSIGHVYVNATVAQIATAVDVIVVD